MSRASREFLRKQASTVRNPNVIEGSNPDRRKSMVSLGKLYFYRYDPKTKGKLPYYDRLPLVIPFAPTKQGFYGLNLHYLPPILRAKLFDALYDTATNTKLDSKTRLRITYEKLATMSKFRFFKPCLKQYLFNHVRSQFIEIHPTEWNTALMLPCAQFKKAREDVVWKDSRDKITEGMSSGKIPETKLPQNFNRVSLADSS